MQVSDAAIGGIYNVFYHLSQYNNISILDKEHNVQSIVRFDMKPPALYTTNAIEMSIKTQLANMRINIMVEYPDPVPYYYYGTRRNWTLRTGLTSNYDDNNRFVERRNMKFNSDFQMISVIFSEICMLLSAQTNRSISDYHLVEHLLEILIRLVDQDQNHEIHWCYYYVSYARFLLNKAKDTLNRSEFAQIRLY